MLNNANFRHHNNLTVDNIRKFDKKCLQIEVSQSHNT